ncbi:MAG: phosphoribosyl-ATP pyrophosphohydrolase/phosphoribosyl-AMP cyclohydrolase [Myxococcota bacterium]|jgi:phosphoribosyl-ATP pyrophosphohydrolase/phosphoribosyl-AMP cyclohydrolase
MTLIPAIAQDHRTGRVLMLAYMNDESLRLTLETGQAHYWSRSRQALWRKGETSGNTQRVIEARMDCDGDTILLLIEQSGPACHTNEPSCFFEALPGGEKVAPPPATAIERLGRTIHERRDASADSSWTARLLSRGLGKIVEKVREESEELAVALESESDERVISESADVLYHLLVGLEARGLDFEAVQHELARRFGTSGIEEKASRGAQGETL